LRISLLSLKNFFQDQRFLNDFISLGGPKTLQNISKRTFEDEDVTNMVNESLKNMEHYIDEMSTFSEYSQEVRSGQLESTPTHESTKFWNQNIEKFEENNFNILKLLIQLLKSPNLKTQTIALKDIGSFVINHKDGRNIVNDLGAKTIIMGLMESNDEEVRLQALSTTQKLMLQNWAYLDK